MDEDPHWFFHKFQLPQLLCLLQGTDNVWSTTGFQRKSARKTWNRNGGEVEDEEEETRESPRRSEVTEEIVVSVNCKH